MNGYFITSNVFLPYDNLALEEYLFRMCEEDKIPVLYLWQNDNTVVIGRNQNAYTECNMRYVNEHHIHITRRLTGGGAVYHDLGNLNFTMIFPKDLYDISRSTNVIVTALRAIGIIANANSRNDICIGEKKISGNAYYSTANAGMHHGTILYQIDMRQMENALAVSAEKLSKHSVTSVRARVTDIVSKYPKISLQSIKNAIKERFQKEYGISDFIAPTIFKTELDDILKKYRSKEWNIEKITDYGLFQYGQFDWGNATVSVDIDGTDIVGVEISTDALETDIVEIIGSTLNGLKNKLSFKELEKSEIALFEKYPKQRKIISDLLELYVQCIKQAGQ